MKKWVRLTKNNLYRSKEENSFQCHALQSHPQSEEFFHGVVVPNSLNESQKIEIKDEPSENELNDDYIENVDEVLENQENNVSSEDLRYVKFKYPILEAVPKKVDWATQYIYHAGSEFKSQNERNEI